MATCSPPSDFDVLRARTEYLGPVLHAIAVYKDPWLNLIPREEFPRGAGYEMSNFTIAPQYPRTAELAWTAIAAPNAQSNPLGACSMNYEQAYAGELERKHKPEKIAVVGPTVCQDDFVHKWESARFWASLYEALVKMAVMVPINRLGTVYMQYSSKFACKKNGLWVAGTTATQPAAANTEWDEFLDSGSVGRPVSYLTQQYLDSAVRQLIQAGAPEGDVATWINMVEGGPIFPILIGMDASRIIETINPERRADTNAGYMGLKEMNPTLMRLGASKVIGNCRHVITPFPRRYAYVPYGTEINITATGTTATSGTVTTYDNTFGATNDIGPTPVLNKDQIVFIPDHVASTNSNDVTQGVSYVVNGVWEDPTIHVASGSSVGVEKYEACVFLNPQVMTEHNVMPVNSMPGMKLTPQNYMGEWHFKTGISAFLNINGCTTVSDPLDKLGRHFMEYRSSKEPIHPEWGRVLLFKLCPEPYDEATCS